MPQIRNYDPPSDLLTRVKSRDASASKKPIIIKNENCFKNGMFSFKTKVTIKSKWARKK